MLNYILSARMVNTLSLSASMESMVLSARSLRKCQLVVIVVDVRYFFGRTRAIRIHLIGLSEGFVENCLLGLPV
jgi:hypothetical protein